jgi:hypothetical protein
MSASLMERLAAPFPPELVSWRVGSTTQDKKKGMALAFIDARDVMNRLDEVVGPENWQDRYPHAGAKTVCEIDIWCEGRGWVTKADGAGDTDVEKEKGSLSDAFKRAAVRWGIGRYLYDLPSPWVELEPAGRSFKISAAGQAMLKRVMAGEKVSTEAPQNDGPAAVDLAIRVLRDTKSGPEFKAVWEANYQGWKDVMDPLDYARVQAVKAEMVKRFTPAKEAA